MKHHIHEWIKALAAYQWRLVPVADPRNRVLPLRFPFPGASMSPARKDTVQELCRVLAFQASSTKEIN